ncbi:class I SAM-dependent methyltransferase [Labrys sp. KNU-23]|uniref:class I SAM-dependent methyltransferase n=1 Tax=Labrys sp. KNU-23 TaxID=2789216 RepID=UPI0011ED1F28|nr:class I SAM-dependent methyltransferase [Labrys sp. KNU-23]QEN87078.1 class I SAM-dependent methyltransferase [Labrys sp. KNU-23]
MSAKDDVTIAFYAEQASAYTMRGQVAQKHRLDQFLSHVAPGGSVLELGCGAGQDSEYMLAGGFDVTPTDGTAEIAHAAAERLGRPVDVLLFEAIEVREAYDGVWANACLLHVPRTNLSAIIGRIHRALKPGGVFHASFKAGEAEGRDQFGRYYNYPSADWLEQAYRPGPWESVGIDAAKGGGYDNKPTDWLFVLARKARC